jgi:hypothetical protein
MVVTDPPFNAFIKSCSIFAEFEINAMGGGGGLSHIHISAMLKKDSYWRIISFCPLTCIARETTRRISN